MKEETFVKELLKLSKMFDIGCEIRIVPSENDIVITGTDYHYDKDHDGDNQKEHWSVEKTYDIEIEETDDGKYLSNYEEVMSQIAEERSKLASD